MWFLKQQIVDVVDEFARSARYAWWAFALQSAFYRCSALPVLLSLVSIHQLGRFDYNGTLKWNTILKTKTV